ncbi:MAG: DUF1616 domain-containing protein [Candidatus Methanosuratincola sp.]
MRKPGWLEKVRERAASGRGGYENPQERRGSREEEEDEDEEEESEKDEYELDELAEKILDFIRDRRSVPLAEAVSSAASSLGVKETEVARRVYALSSAGMIRIRDVKPPRSFFDYLSSAAYSIWYWGITAAVVATAALVLAAPGEPFVYLRYILGSAFVLYLPGAALIELLYPKSSDLSRLERFALSLGLSIAIVPLVGIVLNYTPWGIRLNPILVSVSAITLATATGAAVRKFSYLRLASGLE